MCQTISFSSQDELANFIRYLAKCSGRTLSSVVVMMIQRSVYDVAKQLLPQCDLNDIKEAEDEIAAAKDDQELPEEKRQAAKACKPSFDDIAAGIAAKAEKTRGDYAQVFGREYDALYGDVHRHKHAPFMFATMRRSG